MRQMPAQEKSQVIVLITIFHSHYHQTLSSSYSMIVYHILHTGSLSLFFGPVFGDIERNLFVNLPFRQKLDMTEENIFGQVRIFFANVHLGSRHTLYLFILGTRGAKPPPETGENGLKMTKMALNQNSLIARFLNFLW